MKKIIIVPKKQKTITLTHKETGKTIKLVPKEKPTLIFKLKTDSDYRPKRKGERYA